jgi:hypothetical protein
LNFIYFNLSIFFLYSLGFWCHSQEIIAKPNVIKLSLRVFFNNFVILPFMVRSSVFFELFFTCHKQKAQLYTFASGHTISTSPFVENTVLSLWIWQTWCFLDMNKGRLYQQVFKQQSWLVIFEFPFHMTCPKGANQALDSCTLSCGEMASFLLAFFLFWHVVSFPCGG